MLKGPTSIENQNAAAGSVLLKRSNSKEEPEDVAEKSDVLEASLRIFSMDNCKLIVSKFYALQVPDLMRKSSSKRILNQRPLNLPTKTLRTKSLLWVKPTVTVDQLSASVLAQVRNFPDVSQHNKACYKLC